MHAAHWPGWSISREWLRVGPSLLRMGLLGLGLLAWLFFGWPTVAEAQTSQTGALQGQVVLEAGDPVPGVAVILERQAGGSRQVVTDEQGRFMMSGLLPGIYEARAEMDGLEPGRAQVQVSAGSSRQLDLVLGMEAIGEALEVVAERPLIETATTELGVNVDAESFETLPSARTATDLVKLTPGGSGSALWGGSTSQANSYKLDGVSVNQPGFGGDFLLPNVDWIEELQVRGLGAGAEYGNFQGGLINIVTKSGGNDLKVGVRLNMEDPDWNASNLNAREAGFEAAGRDEINIGVSGPLQEDRLFYFVSGQQVRADDRIVDVDQSGEQLVFLPVQEERTELKFLGKLTWQIGDSDSLSMVLGYDSVETDNRGLSSFTAPEAASTQDSPSVFYNIGWIGALGSGTFLELKATGYDGDNDRTPLNGDTPAVRILGGDRETFSNAVFTRLQSPSSQSLSAGTDSFFSLGGMQHQLKIGGEIEDGRWRERRVRNGGFTWRPEEGQGPFDSNDPATWGFISSDWGSGIELDADTVNGAVYVQDYIDINDRLRLSLGLRYGWWQGDLTPGFGSGSSFEAVSDEAVDPRLGWVWDVAGDGSWIAKAHWGRYHQSLFALLFDRAIGGNVFQDEEYWDWVGPGLPEVGRSYSLQERDQLFELFDVVATGEEVGLVTDYNQPFVDQLVLSLEHALNSRWKVGLTFVNRENDDIVALVDRNLASNYTAFNNVAVIDFRSGDPVLDADGRPLVLPQIFVGNDDIIRRGWAPGLTDAEVDALTYDPDLVLSNAEGAERKMDQWQLTLEGRTESVDLTASLVYTDLVGDFFSVSGYANPTGTGAGSFVNPNEQTLAYGALSGVAEWEAKVSLSARLPWQLRAGIYASYATGERFAPTYMIDNRNHDFQAENGEFFSFRHFSNVNGEQIFLEPRGSRELDESTLIDLHLDRLFDLGFADLIVGFDVFNLLNDDAVDEVQTEVGFQSLDDPTTLFGAPRGRVSARTSRLYVSLKW